MNGSSSSSICPCDGFTFPQIITNSPGLSTIAYRVGDYLAFREALLRSCPGEIELANWRPGAEGDLAVQMVEWWAYLADILTFYNERIANEDYLQTAVLPASVQGLIRILGYRPRPGIGATGTLAALLTGIKPVTLPAGFQIQSKPGPGEQPQIFELGAQTLVSSPDSISADPVANQSLSLGGVTVLLQGTVSSIKAGDQLLLVEKGWTGSDSNWAVVTVSSVSTVKDPRGSPNTSVVFTQSISLPGSPQVQNYRLCRSAQSAHVWQYHAQKVIQANQVDLESITRTINVGDPVLFSVPDALPVLQLVSVTSYTEVVWYANPDGPPYDPTIAPGGSPPIVAIPIPHTHIGFQPALTKTTDTGTERSQTLVLFAWQDVGTLIATPSTTLTGTQISLVAALPASMPTLDDQDVLISDANGNGVEAEATADPTATDPTAVGLSSPNGPSDTTWNTTLTSLNLQAPLTVLFNLLQVTRGKTVANEILGSGDATITTGQEFVLQQSPLTYLEDATSTSGSGYTSTLQVWVDGVEWQEVQSFYGQGPNAQVFVTREDDQNMTHVQFGDGVYGSRLPSGINNVVATYRFGSGAESPDPGSLSVILKSWPGLKSILNPVQVGGGADPDPPAQIKTYAPQSVLTFGRAISGDDYEAIAAQAPGVARAAVYWSWNTPQQRMMVNVYVGDDANAVISATTALAGASDPNRPLSVNQAQPVDITLNLTLVVDPKYVLDDVVTAATAALVDPHAGLLGANVVQIGESIFQSQIYQACLNVAGVVAVHGLTIAGVTGQTCSTCPNCDYRYDPGEGYYFTVTTPAANIISPEVATNGG